jgi:very-short-patch-repair endonuclease
MRHNLKNRPVTLQPEVRSAKHPWVNPERSAEWFEGFEKELRVPHAKTTTPSLESWKDRAARMHPQKSEMEKDMLIIFGNDESLRPVVTDRSYPIVTVTPDFVFPRHNLALFLDGKHVHDHRQDRDEQLRKALADRYALKVLSLTYEGNSEAEKQRVLKETKEAC